MWFQVHRVLRAEQIFAAMQRAAGTGEVPALPEANEVHPRPTYTRLQWSTVQSAVFERRQQRSFDYRAEPDGPRLVHVLVGCTRRFEPGTTLDQRYALVASLEHDSETVRLYQAVRQRVEQRVRVTWQGSLGIRGRPVRPRAPVDLQLPYCPHHSSGT
jgi:hypothetical protein